MSTPYWSGDGITLYLGDCLEITAWLEPACATDVRLGLLPNFHPMP
jgi:hypothetical protein